MRSESHGTAITSLARDPPDHGEWHTWWSSAGVGNQNNTQQNDTHTWCSSAGVGNQNNTQQHNKNITYAGTLGSVAVCVPFHSHVRLKSLRSFSWGYVCHWRQRILEHMCVFDSTYSVQEVLDLLQEHIKGRYNEVLSHHAFTSCRQAEGESFDDFFVHLKSLSEIVCTRHTAKTERKSGSSTESCQVSGKTIWCS